MSEATQLSRRAVLQGAGALVIGTFLPTKAVLASDLPPVKAFAPNAFVRVDPDDTITVIVKHIEMGQGPMTGLSTIVAEEMDASWSKVRAMHAPADAKIYNNLLFGTVQGTGGSTAIANSFEQMRKVGATVR